MSLMITGRKASINKAAKGETQFQDTNPQYGAM